MVAKNTHKSNQGFTGKYDPIFYGLGRLNNDTKNLNDNRDTLLRAAELLGRLAHIARDEAAPEILAEAGHYSAELIALARELEHPRVELVEVRVA